MAETTMPGLAPAELASWREDGYILRRGVLSADEVDVYREAARRVTAPLWGREPDPRYPDDAGHSVRQAGLIAASPHFDDLIDHPLVLGALVDLMGPGVQLAGSEVFARRMSTKPISRFHTDFGPFVQRVRLDPDSAAIQLKVQFFLTDVLAHDQANFVLIPGSHRSRTRESGSNCHVGEANASLDEGRWPDNAVQVTARAGDAIIFGPGLWHAVAANPRGVERLTVILRYSQLWCRPHDHSSDAAELRSLSPRRRRLLGVLPPTADPMEYYKPTWQEEFGRSRLDA